MCSVETSEAKGATTNEPAPSPPPPVAVRHSEKDRVATCAFADDVAQRILDARRRWCPGDLIRASGQTVVAGLLFIPHGRSTAADGIVLSVASGTKYVEYGTTDSEHHVVHDMHAEALVQRALQRVLLVEIRRICDGLSSIFLERRTVAPPQFALKGKLHFYTSSAPCGNACIKAWGKGCRVVPLPRLPDRQAPTPADFVPAQHPRLHVVAAQDGQVAVLVKRRTCESPRRGNRSPSEEQSAMDRTAVGPPVALSPPPAARRPPRPERRPQENHPRRVKHLPPGCAVPNTEEGTVPSCSDLMAVWNALGWQGRRATPWFMPSILVNGTTSNRPSDVKVGKMETEADKEKEDGRVAVATVTVGRKFSLPHLARALCCRLQDIGGKKQPTRVGINVHHPVLLCTSVKLDESVRQQDDKAVFDDPRAFVAAVTSSGTAVEEAGPLATLAEVLVDGKPTLHRVGGSDDSRFSATSAPEAVSAFSDAELDKLASSAALPPPAPICPTWQAMHTALFSSFLTNWPVEAPRYS